MILKRKKSERYYKVVKQREGKSDFKKENLTVPRIAINVVMGQSTDLTIVQG